jgi:hypothetical protein
MPLVSSDDWQMTTWQSVLYCAVYPSALYPSLHRINE